MQRYKKREKKKKVIHGECRVKIVSVQIHTSSCFCVITEEQFNTIVIFGRAKFVLLVKDKKSCGCG